MYVDLSLTGDLILKHKNLLRKPQTLLGVTVGSEILIELNSFTTMVFSLIVNNLIAKITQAFSDQHQKRLRD